MVLRNVAELLQVAAVGACKARAALLFPWWKPKLNMYCVSMFKAASQRTEMREPHLSRR